MSTRPVTANERAIIVASLGMTTKQIAVALGLSTQTVKNTRHHVYQKLNISGPGSLFRAAVKLGIVQVEKEGS